MTLLAEPRRILEANKPPLSFELWDLWSFLQVSPVVSHLAAHVKEDHMLPLNWVLE